MDFPRGISLKVNVIAQMELELANIKTAAQHFNYYTTGIPSRIMFT